MIYVYVFYVDLHYQADSRNLSCLSVSIYFFLSHRSVGATLTVGGFQLPSVGVVNDTGQLVSFFFCKKKERAHGLKIMRWGARIMNNRKLVSSFNVIAVILDNKCRLASSPFAI